MLFKKPFGLDISDYSIELVSLGGKFREPKLLAMGNTLLSSGVFSNGRILDKQILKNAIEGLIQNPKFGKLRTKKFIFSLPESKSLVHISELPKDLKKDEISEFVKSQVKEHFPYSFEELYFDYCLQAREVLLVAVPKNIVKNYLDVFKDCKLQPVALEIESISLGRALLGEKAETTLIIDIGARVTNLNIFDGGRLRMSDTLPIGGNRFTQILAEKLSLSQTEAEKLKKKIGLDPKFKKGRAFLILQKEIQPIIEEIGKVKGYFREKTGKDVEKIILAGGSSAMPHLLEYLKENLNIPLDIADPWVRINIDILKKKEYFQEALKVNPALYSTVIGSARRGLIRNPAKADINLLPPNPVEKI